ncbi:Derlin-2.2 protein [Vigna angularis]|uniref:Derlin n=1 Tax=Phaseolus angularis TaxID=3914 RepID=A0A8T0K7H3_PHAAN|nr:Derlin-2.2 protein [Vigna angularis]
MAQAVEEWYKQMPVITRSYLTAAVVTTIGCSLDVKHLSSHSHTFRVSNPFSAYLFDASNLGFPIDFFQVTNSLFTDSVFGGVADNFSLSSVLESSIGGEAISVLASGYEFLCYARETEACIDYLDFLFHMFFLARYCKLLEENSFRGRTADFFYMLLFGATVLTGIVLLGGMIPYLSESFAKIIFLSNSLTFMMVYVWSKQNPFIHMSFLGLFTFTAAYLPWVLLGFSVLVGASAWVDLLGMIAGHAYYFLEDVYPRMTGRRPLKTPSFIKALFADDPVVVARPANVRFAPPPADELHQD